MVLSSTKNLPLESNILRWPTNKPDQTVIKDKLLHKTETLIELSFLRSGLRKLPGVTKQQCGLPVPSELLLAFSLLGAGMYVC